MVVDKHRCGILTRTEERADKQEWAVTYAVMQQKGYLEVWDERYAEAQPLIGLHELLEIVTALGATVNDGRSVSMRA